MHPAFSVIFFTVASGAGYGLMFVFLLFGLAGRAPTGGGFGWLVLVAAFLLVSSGLLSSFGHLGRPERFWRAFSQWRSSWLSREGVMAMASYLPCGLFALDWLLLRDPVGRATIDAAHGTLAILGLLCCAATVYCTAMIYASLKPIAQWRQPLVPPLYLANAAMSGSLIFAASAALMAAGDPAFAWTAAVAIAAAAGIKRFYWRAIDTAPGAHTAAAATGLAALGTVRLLDPPHTEANYLQQEMGFQIARKHAGKLRLIAWYLGYIGPLPAVLLSVALPQAAAAVLLTLAALVSLSGLAVERWLFFAEAKHTVTLYYGAARA